MSFHRVDENSSSDIISPTGNELHQNAFKHDHAVDDDSRTSLVQQDQDLPRHLPWQGIAQTNSPEPKSEDGATNMDTMPMQYELHSNTKTHQLGGVYESYSALN